MEAVNSLFLWHATCEKANYFEKSLKYVHCTGLSRVRREKSRGLRPFLTGSPAKLPRITRWCMRRSTCSPHYPERFMLQSPGPDRISICFMESQNRPLVPPDPHISSPRKPPPAAITQFRLPSDSRTPTENLRLLTARLAHRPRPDRRATRTSGSKTFPEVIPRCACKSRRMIRLYHIPNDTASNPKTAIHALAALCKFDRAGLRPRLFLQNSVQDCGRSAKPILKAIPHCYRN